MQGGGITVSNSYCHQIPDKDTTVTLLRCGTGAFWQSEAFLDLESFSVPASRLPAY